MMRALLLLLFSLLSLPAFAQQPPAPPAAPAPGDVMKPDEQGLAMRVQPLADGIGRANRWTALRITILNVGESTTAVIGLSESSAEGESVGYRREIELPQGSRKDVVLPIRPSFTYGQRVLRLDTEDGRALDRTYPLELLADGDVAVAVIGDDPIGINAVTSAWGGPVPGRTVRLATTERKVRTGLVPLAAIPDRSAAWSAIDWVVWPQPDPSEIGPEQLDALKHYVADGGHLVVTVTDNWSQVAGSPLAELLPVALTGVRDAEHVDPLLLKLGAAAAGPVTTPVAVAAQREVQGRGAWTWAALDDGRPLWVSGTYGLGTVHVLTVDPTLAPFAGAAGVRENLWRRVLWLPPPGAPAEWWRLESGWVGSSTFTTVDWQNSSVIATSLDTWDTQIDDPPLPSQLADALHLGTSSWYANVVPDLNQGWGPSYDWGIDLRDKLNDIPGVAPLPLSWLMLFSAAYLFAIGPFDWLVLRLLGRQPLTWVTFPFYIVLFSAIALVGTSLRKGSQAAVVRVELVDVLPGTALWRGDTHLGVFSTRKTELSLRGGFEDAVVAPLDGEHGAMWDVAVLADEGPGNLAWRAETWTLAYVQSTWTTAAQGGLAVTRTDQTLHVTSTLPVDLAAATLVARGNRYDLGPIKAGETREIPLGAPLYIDPYYGGDVKLGTALPEELLGWAAGKQVQRPPFQRGHYDAQWAHPVVLGVTTTPIEPLVLSGLEPETRSLTVFRIPVEPAVVASLASAAAAVTAYDPYGYVAPPPPPTTPVYAIGTKLEVKELHPNDGYAYDSASIVGLECSVTSEIVPADHNGWFSGGVRCGQGLAAREFWFYQFKFDVLQAAPPTYPVSTSFKITALGPEDGNYGERAKVVGLTCKSSDLMSPSGGDWYEGSAECADKQYRYFYQVRFDLLQPATAAAGTRVKIKAVGPNESYNSWLVGRECTTRSEIVPSSPGWHAASLDCDGGWHDLGEFTYDVTSPAPGATP